MAWHSTRYRKAVKTSFPAYADHRDHRTGRQSAIRTEDTTEIHQTGPPTDVYLLAAIPVRLACRILMGAPACYGAAFLRCRKFSITCVKTKTVPRTVETMPQDFST